MSQPSLSGLTGPVRLIYVSRWAGDPALDLNEEVRKIMIKSIANNRLVNVTGLLLVHEGWFVQALEGPAQGVRETYERIGADPRHDEITLLDVATGQPRAFRDWNMTERRITALQKPLIDRFGKDGAFHPPSMSGDEAFGLLKTVGAAYVA